MGDQRDQFLCGACNGFGAAEAHDSGYINLLFQTDYFIPLPCSNPVARAGDGRRRLAVAGKGAASGGGVASAEDGGEVVQRLTAYDTVGLICLWALATVGALTIQSVKRCRRRWAGGRAGHPSSTGRSANAEPATTTRLTSVTSVVDGRDTGKRSMWVKRLPRTGLSEESRMAIRRKLLRPIEQRGLENGNVDVARHLMRRELAGIVTDAVRKAMAEVRVDSPTAEDSGTRKAMADEGLPAAADSGMVRRPRAGDSHASDRLQQPPATADPLDTGVAAAQPGAKQQEALHALQSKDAAVKGSRLVSLLQEVSHAAGENGRDPHLAEEGAEGGADTAGALSAIPAARALAGPPAVCLRAKSFPFQTAVVGQSNDSGS